ncbi:MAG: hypothetical protein JXB32_06200 [Deltaproteobacteria bacterium]|nr:hypothetical protein [Deltaproteobacteria bacterium]
MRNYLVLGGIMLLGAVVLSVACGDDDSGVSCPAARDCTGRVCGPDPICMTSCGDCPGGQTCDAASGTCICTPNCSGRECGDDGCGGSCGTCPPGSACDAAGRCTCTSNCTGRECGDDGCGGSCGTCTPPATCGADGRCRTDCPAAADCTGRECGPDPICMTSCGTCPTGETCTSSGTCVPGACNSTTCATGCCEAGTCMPGTSDDYCGTGGYPCGPCAAGDSCFEHWCVANCTPCTSSTDCTGGASCGRRRCDGAAGCYATADASCTLIGGVPCPEVSAYDTCTTSEECGPYADCYRFADGTNFCGRRCAADSDCPSPPAGYESLVRRCNTGATTPRCYLECSGPGTCPYGHACFRYATGDYGYCA